MHSGSVTAEERGLAVAAHLSGLAGYVIPLGGIIVPVIIWIVKSDSPVISTIAKQAVWLNVCVWLLIGLGWLLLFTIVLIPLSFVIWIVAGLAALVLPIVGAVKASDGTYYRYPLIGLEPRA